MSKSNCKDRKETAVNEGGKPNQSNRKNGRNRNRPNYRQGNKPTPASEVHRDTHGDNDIAWYAKNPQILKDAASVQFFTPAGSGLRLSNSSPDYVTVPGIYSIEYVPTIGRAMDWTDPANIMCRTVYDFVRSKNSGSKNYDATHLGFYILGADSVLTMWAYMVRIYSCLNYVNGLSRYTGNALLRAMNVNAADLRANQARARSFINNYAARASIMCIPANLPYYARHMWMCTNIYKDSPDAKAQLYFYKPRILYKYNTGTVEEGASLTPVSVSPASPYTMLTWSNIESTANSILESMINQEDFMVISGDILKAYGSENMFRFAAMPEDRVIEPVYNSEVLQQIHNATICGVNPDDDQLFRLKITQNTQVSPDAGNIMYQPILQTAESVTPNPDVNLDHSMLDLYGVEASPENVMEATRLKLWATTYSMEAGNGVIPQYYGTEILTRAAIWKTSIVNGVESSFSSTLSTCSGTGVNSSFLEDSLQFDMAPLFIRYAGGTPYRILGELDNYTTIDSMVIKRCHEAAILSMFNIPMDVNI